MHFAHVLQAEAYACRCCCTSNFKHGTLTMLVCIKMLSNSCLAHAIGLDLPQKYHAANRPCLFEESPVLLCPECHGKFISATEVAGLKALLVCRLSLLIFQPVNVLGSLHQHAFWHLAHGEVCLLLLIRTASNSVAHTVNYTLLLLVKTASDGDAHTSETHGCFFSK